MSIFTHINFGMATHSHLWPHKTKYRSYDFIIFDNSDWSEFNVIFIYAYERLCRYVIHSWDLWYQQRFKEIREWISNYIYTKL